MFLRKHENHSVNSEAPDLTAASPFLRWSLCFHDSGQSTSPYHQVCLPRINRRLSRRGLGRKISHCVTAKHLIAAIHPCGEAQPLTVPSTRGPLRSV